MTKRIFSTSRATLLCASIACSLGIGSLKAINVDSEIVILVDAQTSSLSDFDLILDGVARTFEQQSFIDTVAAGANGSIAASLVLFNNGNTQTIEIAATQLSSAADLQNFATSVRNVTRSNQGGNVDYAGAIAAGAAEIASSAFEGTVRQLTLIDDGTGFFEANPGSTRAARDTALASSVDVINSVVFDAEFQEQRVTDFYEENIVGAVSGANGTVAVIGSPQGGTRPQAALDAIEESIQTQLASPTTNAVPEPSSALYLLTMAGVILFRRKRA